MKATAPVRFFLVLVFLSLLTLAPLTVARGASTNVRTCDEAGLDAALAEGGANTFACAAATTITVSATKAVVVSGTVLDGGGLLTISGGGVRQVFTVGSDVIATFANLTIRDGVAANGAAIQSLGSLVISNVYFLNNTVVGGGGAVVANGPSLVVTGCTFSGNTATGENSMGGALFISSGRVPTITNTTFYANSAQRGGAILTSGSSVSLTVTASTFSSNIATTEYGASGIFNTNGSVALRNCVFNTTSGRNCNGSITDGGNNLQYGGAAKSCGSTILEADPRLSPLAENGGMTPTMALLSGSPAIDKIAAEQCIVATDQRGYPRPAFGGLSATCDIGAFEGQQKVYLPLITRRRRIQRARGASGRPASYGCGVGYGVIQSAGHAGLGLETVGPNM
jgi:hypothetical protein